MFCSKCGNPLSDDAKFCGVCGTPVNTVQENSPVMQQPVGTVGEAESIQMPKPAPFMQAPPFNGQIGYGVAASVQKKSKKGLIIGLSIGGVLLAVILAAVLIFVFGLKGGAKRSDSFVPIGIDNAVAYDDEYTYYLSEDDRGSTARIMRVGNEQDAQPEILYEVDQIRGDDWGMYPLNMLFLWEDKVCFFELTHVSDDSDEDEEINLCWISKDGKNHGTLVSYEQLNELINNERFAQVRNIYYYENALVFSNGQNLIWLDLKTGALREQNDVIQAGKPIRFVAYDQGYYYYFAFDAKVEVAGGTLYRKKEGAEAEKICVMPELAYTSELDHATLSTCVPKGNYLYFADETMIFRIHMENGDVEPLAAYEGAENRFAVSDAGLYYLKDMSLRLIDFETLAETVFDLPKDTKSPPRIIYPGSDGSCWLKQWEDGFQYNRFIPDEKGGSYTYFGKKPNGTEESDQTSYADSSSSADITSLYKDVVENFIGRYGSLGFGESDNEFYAQGVFKIDLLDLNQDGTDELMLLYTDEETGIYPYIELFTVEDGGLVKLFSQRSRKEFHEAAMSVSLYQNGGNLYVPVYDSLDSDPIYVHLYGFDENGEFREVYTYENNAFYMNQLPDGMKFTKCEETQFYTNTQFAYDKGFENVKEEMTESLRTDMEYMLNVLGIAVPENLSTQAGQSEFDITPMLGEWTLEIAKPNTENVSHYLIRLWPDGIMDLRAEDGSWQNYTYTMDNTHFSFTYSATGITSGGTYTVSGDKIIFSMEN